MVGIAISVLAYLPQVVHLAREHCSAGVSIRAWSMWLVSSVLIGALAFHQRDAVFILLQLSTFASAAAVVLLARRYRGLACDAHSDAIPGTVAHTQRVKALSLRDPRRIHQRRR